MKEVYIVVYHKGYGDDYCSDNVSVCFDKQKAQDICDTENKIIKLTTELWNQIGEFKEAPEIRLYRNNDENIEEYDKYLKEHYVLYGSWCDELKIYQSEQVQSLIDKSDLSTEIKEKIVALTQDTYSFLNHNNYAVDTVPVVDS